MYFSKLILSSAARIAKVLPNSVKANIYTVKPLARFLRTSLNLAAPEGQTLVTISSGGLEGFRCYLDLKTEKDYWLGTYEIDLQEAASTLIKKGDVVYDVGANIGYMSMLFARYAGMEGKIFAFEAFPQNVERMKKNITINNLENQIIVLNYAVVDSNKEVSFLVGPSHETGKAEGSVGRKETAYRDRIIIQGISLDDFVFSLDNPLPDVVKMDIEGGEVMALPGMKRVLQEGRPLVFLELHGPEAATQAKRILQTVHYDIHSLEKGFPNLPYEKELDWKMYLIATPEEKTIC